jgi:hypothetical protein
MNMKKYNLFHFIMTGLLSVFMFASCNKDDGPIKKSVLDIIDAVPVISTNIEASGSQAINLLNLSAFAGKFTVSQFFAGSTPPEKVDVVVRKNGGTGTAVKVFKAGVTSFPVTYTVTTADLTALFGAPALGDRFDFSVDIYAGGKKFEAFPVGGVSSGPGPAGMPGYNEFVRFAVICAYDPAIFEGTFRVVDDEWDEFQPGQLVTVTRVSNNQFSIKWDCATCTVNNPTPVTFTVNTANNGVSIDPRQQMGASYSWNTSYGKAYIQVSANAASSFVEPCDARITIAGAYSVDAGSFSGLYKLILIKQ